MAAGDWIGLSGLAVSIIGFWLAIVQLRRTASATKLTAEKITETLSRMNVNHLLVLLPQLRLVETDLDQAAEDDDRKLAQRTLITYAHTANQVAALLEVSADQTDIVLVGRLRASAKMASQSKAALVRSSKPTVRSATREVAADMGELAGLAAGLIAQYQSKVA